MMNSRLLVVVGISLTGSLAAAQPIFTEEKTGRGTVIDRTGRYEVARVFVRLDRNYDVFIRVYPKNGRARTLNGRWSWENGRRNIYVGANHGFLQGRGEVKMHNRGRDQFTFTEIRMTGEDGRTRAELTFRPDNPTRPGNPIPVEVEEWNRRNDPNWNSGGGWGSGGSGGNWEGGWGNDLSFDTSVRGRGDMNYRGDRIRIDRASVKRERNGVVSVILRDGNRSFPVSGRYSDVSGRTIRFTIDRAMGVSAEGRGTIFLDSRREIERVVFSGRQDRGSSFEATFQR